jgi:hypothetical protein
VEERNRHPADRLADVRQDIKRLEQEEQELRIYLLEHPHDRTGMEHIATIGEQRRSRVDLKALANEVGHSLLQRFTHFTSCRTVRLRERSNDGGVAKCLVVAPASPSSCLMRRFCGVRRFFQENKSL